MTNNVNNENYFSLENNQAYMGVSQYKEFKECEVKALAKVKGEYSTPKSEALLIGSYVDAYFSNELDEFLDNTPEILDTRKKEKTIKASIKNKADEIIKAIESDEVMMKFLNGAKQVIFLGNINGVPFKIKIDSLIENAIVDQKIMSSIKELSWKYDKETRKNKQVDFVEAFGYDIQGAVYQEIARQNLGVKLPFILATTSKEENPDKALIEIDQCYLDKALKEVEELAPRFQRIKLGEIEPIGCGNCPVCRAKKKLKGVELYSKFFDKELDDEI